jgi:hypothetical protein
MPNSNLRRISLAVAASVLVAASAAGYWYWRGGRAAPADNAILVIAPYRQHDTWVFDDPQAGLRREPFVAGVPEMIDSLVADIPNAQAGFRLLFSAQPFPGYQQQLDWVREEKGGNWYRQSDSAKEGWICPALFKYYTAPPKSIYVKAEPLAPPSAPGPAQAG